MKMTMTGKMADFDTMMDRTPNRVNVKERVSEILKGKERTVIVYIHPTKQAKQYSYITRFNQSKEAHVLLPYVPPLEFIKLLSQAHLYCFYCVCCMDPGTYSLFYLVSVFL